MRKKEMARRIEELENAVWDMKYPNGVLHLEYDGLEHRQHNWYYSYNMHENPIRIEVLDIRPHFDDPTVENVNGCVVRIKQSAFFNGEIRTFYCIVNTKTREVTEVNEKWQKIVQY